MCVPANAMQIPNNNWLLDRADFCGMKRVQGQEGESLVTARQVIKRQCTGERQGLDLHGLKSVALERLKLSYVGGPKYSGRLAYSHESVDPLLATASSTTGALTIWQHSVSCVRPSKLISLTNFHAAPPTSIQWSAVPGQDHELLTTCEDGLVKIFSVHDRKVVASATARSGSDGAYGTSPLDRNTLGVCYGRDWGVWDRRAPGLSTDGAGGQHSGGPVVDIEIAFGSPLVVTASLDGSVRAWDVRRAKDQPLAELRMQSIDQGVASIQLHDGNTSLLVGCESGTIYNLDLHHLFSGGAPAAWDVDEECGLIKQVYKNGGSNRLNLKKAQVQGSLVYRGDDAGKVHVWDAKTAEVVRSYDGSALVPLLGQSAVQSPIVSATMAPNLAFPQLAFASDKGMFVCAYRETGAASTDPHLSEIEMLDDWAGDEAEEDGDGIYLDGEEDVQPWEVDQLNLRAGECSFRRGYVTQLVFVCDTCAENARSRAGWTEGSSAPDPGLHGLCAQCAEHCHTLIGHDVRNIGEKRDFRCDCGNHHFRQANRMGGQLLCTLEQQKDPTNRENAYNHNFLDRWCYCDGEERLPMIQCVSCSDWYHCNCIHTSFDWSEQFEDSAYLCKTCLDNKPDLAFLRKYPSRPLMDRVLAMQGQVGGSGDDELAGTSSAVGGSGERPASALPPAAAATAAAAEGAQPLSVGTDTAAASSDTTSAQPRHLCAACRRPGGPEPWFRLFQCSAEPQPSHADGDAASDASTAKDAAPDDPSSCCGAFYHVSCLPAEVSGPNTDGSEWLCPACAEVDMQSCDLYSPEVDSQLPSIGWRMQRGRFMEPQWMSLLVDDSHRDIATRAIGGDPAPCVPQVLAAVAANAARAGAAMAFAAASAADESSAQRDDQSLLANLMSNSNATDFDEEIKRAFLAGDEARAFRLAMQRILLTVSDNQGHTRRSLILESDVQRAVEQLNDSVRARAGGRQR